MNVIPLSNKHKDAVEQAVKNRWGSVHVVVYGGLCDISDVPCFVAISDEQELLGYCYYRKHGSEYEVVLIETLKPGVGAGSALINAVISKASDEKCTRVYLQTSNDNTHALRFYQRLGFTMCAFRFHEFDYFRKLKPIIPLTGNHGILLQHQIELEFVL